METKKCTKCGIEKQMEGFYKKPNGGKNGRASACIECYRARKKSVWVLTPERSEMQRRNHYKRKYGITVDEYEALLEAQGGKCKICGREPTKKRLHLDHCHKTGTIRGLLCSKCNAGLGLLGEDVERFLLAIEYIIEGESK